VDYEQAIRLFNGQDFQLQAPFIHSDPIVFPIRDLQMTVLHYKVHVTTTNSVSAC
jgi:hypothetical protein